MSKAIQYIEELAKLKSSRSIRALKRFKRISKKNNDQAVDLVFNHLFLLVKPYLNSLRHFSEEDAKTFYKGMVRDAIYSSKPIQINLIETSKTMFLQKSYFSINMCNLEDSNAMSLNNEKIKILRKFNLSDRSHFKRITPIEVDAGTIEDMYHEEQSITLKHHKINLIGEDEEIIEEYPNGVAGVFYQASAMFEFYPGILFEIFQDYLPKKTKREIWLENKIEKLNESMNR